MSIIAKQIFKIVAWIVCLLIMIGCTTVQNQAELGHNTVPPYEELQTFTSFTENYVNVEITLEKDAMGHLLLAATYTPTKPGFHLYSKDLPKNGIDGAGRPTFLEILQSNRIRATAQLFANQLTTNHYIEGFAEPFPIYPDGPITMRLPIQTMVTNEDLIQAQISITYMACSSNGRCLPPVVEKPVDIIIINK